MHDDDVYAVLDDEGGAGGARRGSGGAPVGGGSTAGRGADGGRAAGAVWGRADGSWVAPRTLSVIVPVYNERDSLAALVQRLDAFPSPCGLARELVFVDDGSTDGSADVLDELLGERTDARLIEHASNRGKGAAIRSGLGAASGDVVLIHDADLEYDPRDHAGVLEPLMDGRADAVIGSRFLGQTHRVLYFWHYKANRLITLCSNACTNLNLSDIECGTKAFSRRVAAQLGPMLKEDRFGIEPEMVGRLAQIRWSKRGEPMQGPGGRRLRIYEVAVSYSGRTYAEGKKIGWRDGVRALWVIARVWLT
ncbi:MAG: glycosyltransferase family 2 protein [Phycisphaerales bacterium]